MLIPSISFFLHRHYSRIITFMIFFCFKTILFEIVILIAVIKFLEILWVYKYFAGVQR